MIVKITLANYSKMHFSISKRFAAPIARSELLEFLDRNIIFAGHIVNDSLESVLLTVQSHQLDLLGH